MKARNSSALLLFSVVAITVGGAPAAYGQTPCSLLTQKQVSTVLGVSVGEGSPIADTGCSWKGTGATKVTVTVSMQSARMFAGAKSATAPGMTRATVAGVGDEAFFAGVANFCSLWVKKGAKFPLVRIYGLSVADAQPKLKALAEDVVSKL